MSNISCWFCGRPSKTCGTCIEGSQMRDATGHTCYICEECSEAVVDTFSEEREKSASTARQKLKRIPTPEELVKHLDSYVIGQELAKRRLAVQVCAHYRRLIDTDERTLGKNPSHTPFVDDPDLRDVEIEKNNMLLLGPTGCGKTLLVRSLARKLHVPLAIGDATTLTEAGYVGEDVENLLLKLLVEADYDVELAQRGIIYIDEIDKIGKTGHNVSITRDVSGEGVQQSLLKMIEGTIANVPPQGGRKHPEQQYVQIDTTNILFVCGGAFNGLTDIIGQRLGKKHIGFGVPPKSEEEEISEVNAMMKQVTEDDLEQFGLIPELIGRLPVVCPMEELSEESLARVLTEPKNALLKQYRKDAAYHRVRLSFAEDAIHEIAVRAKKKGTGARALRSVCEAFMTDINFELPNAKHRGKSYEIDAAVVKGERRLFDEPPVEEAA